MNFAQAVAAKLDEIAKLPPLERLQPGGEDLLPAFAAIRDTAIYLGHARTHDEAIALGLNAFVTCERASRATAQRRPAPGPSAARSSTGTAAAPSPSRPA